MIKKKEKINHQGVQKQYVDEDFIPLCEEYKLKKNASEISKREGVPLQTLYYYIRRLGYNQSKRRHTLKEDYFSNINSQNKAYILGFLMADGCVCKSEPKKSKPDRLIIQISSKDIEILEFIKNELNASYEIVRKIPEGTYATNEIAILTINSMQLCKDLMALGVVPNKTGKEFFPDIKNNLKRHFLRGFLDGDGWVTNQGKTIGFISNQAMLKSIKSYINSQFLIQGKATIREDDRANKKNKNIYYMEFSKKADVEKLKDLLYHNAKFYLKRKYNKIIY